MFLRVVLLAACLASVVVAWREWSDGVPPLWSVLAPRAETVVTRAEMMEESRADGRRVQVPHVYVAWTPEEGTAEELVGLRSSHEFWHMHTAFKDVRDHSAGSLIDVRVVHGHPMADRTDLRDLGYALAASLLAVMSGAGFVALLGARRGREEAAG